MATYADIELEWSALSPDTPERWTGADLQLAAELGKTLLERNKDLENTLRQQQALVDDQTQEIEYLTKQTAALREVNDSRLRIYEQLEVSIQELERNNQRLAVENAADKKQIKSLCHSLDAMESRCEELTRSLEENQAAERRRLRVSREGSTEGGDQQVSSTNSEPTDGQNGGQGEEEALSAQVALLMAQKDRETRRAGELEEQLTSLIQENATLEEQMSNFKMREDQLRSLEEEISSMQGQQVCFRCMRRVGGGTGVSTATPSLMDEDMSSSVMEDESCLDEETDLETEVQSIASETHNTVLSDNPYRVLVEKYEALLSMQRRPSRRPMGQGLKCGSPAPVGLLGRLCSSPLPSSQTENNCLSLQEELQMSGEFSCNGPVSLMLEDYNKVEEGEPREQRTQAPGTGQLYFSEAETNSSSGVSEGDMPRQQHRSTQTDLMSGGGKLLWSISAGTSADCVVNVYDEGADPTESRFQRAPEYRELFSEIFTVLKRSVARSAAASNSIEQTHAELKGAIAAVESKKEKKSSTPDEPKVRGQADEDDDEAGKIEEITQDSDASPSSILSLAGQPRKSRKSKGRKDRKAEQLRRKVLSLSPERFSQEAKKAAAAAAATEEPKAVVPSRDQSPAMSERSDRSSKKGRHWAKRGRPLQLGGTSWPWNRWHNSNAQSSSPSPSPLATTSSTSHVPPPPAPGPSTEKPPAFGFTSSASADVARLKRLEKSYAEALRTSLPKSHRRK